MDKMKVTLVDVANAKYNEFLGREGELTINNDGYIEFQCTDEGGKTDRMVIMSSQNVSNFGKPGVTLEISGFSFKQHEPVRDIGNQEVSAEDIEAAIFDALENDEQDGRVGNINFVQQECSSLYNVYINGNENPVCIYNPATEMTTDDQTLSEALRDYLNKDNDHDKQDYEEINEDLDERY